MTTLVYDEQYGEISRAQRTAYRANNIPPALHDELVEYFGAGNHDAITAYVKSKGRSQLNYGDVYRDKPARPGQDAYWVVTVDRGTGATSTKLVDDADEAHRQAQQLESTSVFTTVVGAR